MRKTILLLMLLIAVPLCFSIEKVLYMNLVVYKEGRAEINDTSVRYGSPDLVVAAPGAYTLQLIGKGQSILYTQNISVSFTVYPLSEHGTPIVVDKQHIYMRIPYNEHYETLSLYEGADLILTVPIGKLLCDYSGKCSGYENYLSCSDCGDGSKDGFCDRVLDKVCDGDCSNDPDCLLQKIDIGKANDSMNQTTPARPITPGKNNDSVDMAEDEFAERSSLPIYIAIGIAILVVLRLIQVKFIRRG